MFFLGSRLVTRSSPSTGYYYPRASCTPSSQLRVLGRGPRVVRVEPVDRERGMHRGAVGDGVFVDLEEDVVVGSRTILLHVLVPNPRERPRDRLREEGEVFARHARGLLQHVARAKYLVRDAPCERRHRGVVHQRGRDLGDPELAQVGVQLLPVVEVDGGGTSVRSCDVLRTRGQQSLRARTVIRRCRARGGASHLHLLLDSALQP
mmetsp:Transcript_4717/g.16903  ORF Transcript_4717/g.16903 Transcript_4717/m.16903 type:complete len:206 (+) Transcript_4717:163-780(+)